MRQRYTHLDSTGRDPIAESFEPYAESIEAVLRTGVGDNGRSPWVWLRLENGDLFLATAPRGSTYEELEHDHSSGDVVDGQARFTVIGFYEDGQRYAEAFWADDPNHAEEQARDSAAASDADLRIAGVVIGEASVAA
jgi:hypothetical protein